jgi:hypothetical protein
MEAGFGPDKKTFTVAQHEASSSRMRWFLKERTQ